MAVIWKIQDGPMVCFGSSGIHIFVKLDQRFPPNCVYSLALLKMKFLFLCILTLLAGSARAQGKYMQNWYFGKNCALDFSTDPPTIKGDNVMNAYSGSACLSDSATGKLLLYTDGK